MTKFDQLLAVTCCLIVTAGGLIETLQKGQWMLFVICMVSMLGWVDMFVKAWRVK